MGVRQVCAADFRGILFDRDRNSARAEGDAASEHLPPADGSRTLAREDHPPPPPTPSDVTSIPGDGVDVVLVTQFLRERNHLVVNKKTTLLVFFISFLF